MFLGLILFEALLGIIWNKFWIINVVGAYVLSLMYLIVKEQSHREKVEEGFKKTRGSVADTLLLYWEENLLKKEESHRSEAENDILRSMDEDKEFETHISDQLHKDILERYDVWARYDPELWHKYFPQEKYSQYLFGMVDNFTPWLEDDSAINRLLEYIKKIRAEKNSKK